MTLDEWEICCVNAIRANFKLRNTRVSQNKTRHRLAVQARRRKVRDWIAALRETRDEQTAPKVAERVFWKVA